MNWGFFQISQLGWLALAPVLIGFYLMKMTRRERTVSALFLWRKATTQARVDSFWQRLRSNLFLWLQLLLLILMVLALARPYRLQPGHLPHQVALILEESASMGARAGSLTRFELAQRKARELITQAPAGTQFLLAGMAQRPRIYHPFTQDREKLLKALDEMRWEAVEAERVGLLPLVLSLTRSNPGQECEVLLLGDKNLVAPTDGSAPVARFLDCRGEPGALRNFAVTAFQVEEDDSGELRAFAGMRSYSEQADTLPFSVLDGEGRVLLTRTVSLAAHGECTLNLDLPKATGPFQLRLDVDDDLAVDNSAWSILPPRRRIRLAVKGEISPFLRQALLAQDGVSLVGADDPQVTARVWGESPPKLPPGNHIVAAAKTSGETALINLVVSGKGPLASFPLGELWCGQVGPIHFKDWTEDPLQPSAWLTGGEEIALLELKGPRHHILAFGFSLDDSNLPLNPALPLILARFLESLPGLAQARFPSQARCGQELSCPSSGPVVVEGPLAGERTRWRIEPSHGRIEFRPVRPGVYTVEDQFLVANFFSAQESALIPVTVPADPGGSPVVPQTDPAGNFAREYWRWAVAGVILISLVEWWLFWKPRP